MTNELERVARALCWTNGMDPDVSLGGDGENFLWHEYLRQADAAIAAMDARPALKVKPLVWKERISRTTDDDNGPREGRRRKIPSWRSGPYEIIRQDMHTGLYILSGLSSGMRLACPYLRDAKAAAQADYERRILDEMEGDTE